MHKHLLKKLFFDLTYLFIEIFFYKIIIETKINELFQIVQKGTKL